jgi:hypothetical protein
MGLRVKRMRWSAAPSATRRPPFRTVSPVPALKNTVVPGSMVSVAAPVTVKSPVTTYGPEAAVHVVFAAIVPKTFWTEPSSYHTSIVVASISWPAPTGPS